MTNTPGNSDFVSLDVLRNLEIGIIVFDTHQEKIIFMNELAEDIFKPQKQTDYQLIFNNMFKNMDMIPTRKSGQQIFTYNDRTVGYTVYPLLDRYLWVFLSDITEKMRLQKIAEAVTLMNNIGFIFSGLAHELGNPINTVKMSLSVLRNNLNTFPPETILEYVENIQSEVFRMEYLLKTMKSFNAYEELQIQNVDLREFMETFLRLVKRDIEKKGIQLQVDFKVENPLVRADPRGLQQILLNLLTNSIDAVEKTEIPEISIDVQKSGDRIFIIISDNGCGISKDQLKNIFLPFYTSKAKGTGLGMAIVRKLLTGMGGTIEITSIENQETHAAISLADSSRAR